MFLVVQCGFILPWCQDQLKGSVVWNVFRDCQSREDPLEVLVGPFRIQVEVGLGLVRAKREEARNRAFGGLAIEHGAVGVPLSRQDCGHRISAQ
jgi:hypothetical protein